MNVTEDTDRSDLTVNGDEECHPSEDTNSLDVNAKEEVSVKEGSNRSEASLKEESNESIDGKDYTQVSDDSADVNPTRAHLSDNTTCMGYDREFMYKLIIR